MAHHAVAHGYARALRPSYFGMYVIFLLAGYALLGRGFAYLGVPPIFVGEIGLLLALATLAYRFYPGLLGSSITWLLMLYMAWGAYCTFPYLSWYGIDALRDGVTWGYALYALAVATIVLRFKAIVKTVDIFRRWVPIFLVSAPILLIIGWFAVDLVPRWPWGPGGGVPLILPSSGDLSVHYAGVFAFVVLGLSSISFQLHWVLLWLSGTLPSMSISRGALLTVASTACLIALLRPTLRYYAAIFGLCIILTVLYVVDFEVVSPTRLERSISIRQLVENFTSVFGAGHARDALEGTTTWRQQWWSSIVDYTFYGPYFWTGKGFGVNLADVDGFRVSAEGALRSPHNIHMTILARSGVPGFTLWVTLQVAFGSKLLVNFLIDRRADRTWLANVQLWVLLYWLAFLVNATFDVFLEGPQGGIWFWSVFGFGLALIVARRESLATAVNSAGGWTVAREFDRVRGRGRSP